MRTNHLSSKLPILLFMVAFSRRVSSVDINFNVESYKDNENFNNGLSYFLTDMMRNYTNWLTDNKLDPSPPVPGTFELKSPDGGRISINCRVTNLHAIGHSNKYIDYSAAVGNMSLAQFFIDRYTTIKFLGDYTISGLIKGNESDLVIQADGKFSLAPPDKYHEIIEYLGFGMDNEYVDIDKGVSDYVFGGPFTHVDFPELLKDRTLERYAPLLKAELANLFQDFLLDNNGQLNPARELLHQYLQHVFRKTRAIFIEAWPIPLPLAPTTTPRGLTTPHDGSMAAFRCIGNVWVLISILAFLHLL